jgi:RNA-binding protein YhbY
MCPRASIINKWGTKYPTRLENCIASVNWVERLAEQLKCEVVGVIGRKIIIYKLNPKNKTHVLEIKK